MNQDMLQEMSVYFPRLDDFYEEGTWLPMYGGATTPGTTTYISGFQSGMYTRMGRVITAHISLGWSAASGTGGAQISLPFPCTSADINEFAFPVYSDRATYTGNTLWGSVAPGNAAMNIVVMRSSAAAALAVAASGYMVCTVVYPIDA